MRLAIAACASLLVFAAAASAQAQDPGAISIEAAGGVAQPFGDLTNEDMGAKTGFGFRVGGAFWFVPQVAAYASYSRYSFGVDEEAFDEENADINWVDSGFNVGIRLALTAADEEMRFSPWLEGGLASRTLSLKVSADGASGEFSFDRKLGFEAAGGFAVTLAEGLSVGPALRYVRYSPDPLTDEEGGETGTVQYLGLELGVSYRIPLGAR